MTTSRKAKLNKSDSQTKTIKIWSDSTFNRKSTKYYLDNLLEIKSEMQSLYKMNILTF